MYRKAVIFLGNNGFIGHFWRDIYDVYLSAHFFKDLYRRYTAFLTCAFSDAVPNALTRDKAFLPCSMSYIGYFRLDGIAKSLFFSFLRALVVSLSLFTFF